MALTRVKSAGATGGYLSSVATSNLPSGTFKRMFHGKNTSQVYMPTANTWYDLCTASNVVVDQNDIVLATYSVTSRVATANGGPCKSANRKC